MGSSRTSTNTRLFMRVRQVYVPISTSHLTRSRNTKDGTWTMGYKSKGQMTKPKSSTQTSQGGHAGQSILRDIEHSQGSQDEHKAFRGGDHHWPQPVQFCLGDSNGLGRHMSRGLVGKRIGSIWGSISHQTTLRTLGTSARKSSSVTS